MNRTRILIAKPDIVKLFDGLRGKVFKHSDLAAILNRERESWRLAQSTTTNAFIDFLTTTSKLRKVIFPFPKPYNPETRYTWGDVAFSDVVLSLKSNCHFSHYSAARIHGLTEQIPKTTYINFEQPLPSNPTGELSQKTIDSAFKKKVRTTNYIAETEDFRVCIINGKNTGYLGVIDSFSPPFGQPNDANIPLVRVTNLERTLIDIAVRPVYSGGVHEVLKAYRLAQPTVSVNRLSAMLKQLKYIYPYHQVIGFYLERAGYKPSLIEMLRQYPINFDFYLAHEMKETEFIEHWRLYVPKGF